MKVETNTFQSVMVNQPDSTAKLSKLVSEHPKIQEQAQITMDRILSNLYSKGQQKEQELTVSHGKRM